GVVGTTRSVGVVSKPKVGSMYARLFPSTATTPNPDGSSVTRTLPTDGTASLRANTSSTPKLIGSLISGGMRNSVVPASVNADASYRCDITWTGLGFKRSNSASTL